MKKDLSPVDTGQEGLFSNLVFLSLSRVSGLLKPVRERASSVSVAVEVSPLTNETGGFEVWGAYGTQTRSYNINSFGWIFTKHRPRENLSINRIIFTSK